MKLSALILLSFAPIFEVAADNKPPLKIVHLGDSYSSGNGASEVDGDGWYGPKWCFRNKYNWGQQAAHKAFGDDFSVTYDNVACSGGVMKHVMESRELQFDVPCSSKSRSKDHSLGPPKGNENDPNPQCSNAVAPQIDAIGKQTDLVFLTIGGNDAGFGDIANLCFINKIYHPKNRKYVGGGTKKECTKRTDIALQDIAKDFSNNFRELLIEITKRMPSHGKVVVVAYPNLALDTKSSDNRNVRKLIAVAAKKQREVIDKVNNELDGEEMVLLYTGAIDSFSSHEAVTFRRLFLAFPKANKDGWFVEFRGFLDRNIGSEPAKKKVR